MHFCICRLQSVTSSVNDSKLKGIGNIIYLFIYLFVCLFIYLILIALLVHMLELIVYGVGYHHAGMSSNDRKLIETMFTNGELPVLCELI